MGLDSLVSAVLHWLMIPIDLVLGSSMQHHHLCSPPSSNPKAFWIGKNNAGGKRFQDIAIECKTPLEKRFWKRIFIVLCTFHQSMLIYKNLGSSSSSKLTGVRLASVSPFYRRAHQLSRAMKQLVQGRPESQQSWEWSKVSYPCPEA